MPGIVLGTEDAIVSNEDVGRGQAINNKKLLVVMKKKIRGYNTVTGQLLYIEGLEKPSLRRWHLS